MKKSLLKKILIIMSFILMTLSTSYIVYAVSLLSGIENMARFLFAVTIAMIWLCSIVSYLKTLKKPKSKYKTIFIITLIYSILISMVAYYIYNTYSTLRNMTSDSTSYSSSLVTLKDNKADDIKDIGNGSLGILADSTSIVGNEMPLEIIKKSKLKGEVLEYDSFIELIKALLAKEVDYAFLPTNYEIMFSNAEGVDFSKIGDQTKIIYTKTKIVKNNESKNNKLDKPFTILLTGVDSENEDISNASANGDSLVLLTFNPTTLSSTILSIPRDTYVPIMCFSGHRKNKITHSAWGGEKCIIDTIENYTGITIDYYLKINFKGVVKLVDTLGGIEVDVPYAFCEQNSNREWGKNTIFVEQGLQTLNGEQALALSRNRHYPSDSEAKEMGKACPKLNKGIRNDFVRGQNQQKVIKALLNKMKSVRNINAVNDILDTVSKSMETNMSTSEILSLYNVGKDILAKSNGENVADLLSMQRLYLNGTDAYIYDQTMKLNLYNYVVYDASLEKVVEAMKVNLGLADPTIDKSFSFSIDTPYKETVIGQNVVGKSSISKLPDFTGDSETQARSTCSKLGISVSFKYVTSGSGTNNTVIAQSYKSGYDVSYVKGLVLTILKKVETKQEQTTVPSKETTTESKQEPVEETTEKEDTKTTTENKEITIEDVTGIGTTTSSSED